MNATTDLKPDRLASVVDIVNRPPAQPAKPRPVQLQVNRSGIWHQVLSMDAGDELAEHYMRTAVELLCAIDSRTSFRVVGSGLAGAGPLIHYCAAGGWITK